MNVNRVFLGGRLTQEVEYKDLPSGTGVATLNVATNRFYKDKNGENKEEVCYVTVTAWDKQAEVCNQYLTKGRPVFVEGRLQTRSWEGSDGQKKSTMDIRAERIQFLGSAKDGVGRAAASVAEEPAAEVQEGTKPETVSWDEEENVV